MSTCFRHLEDDSFLLTFHGLFRRQTPRLQQILVMTAFLFSGSNCFADAAAVLTIAPAEELRWASQFLVTEKFFDQVQEQNSIFKKKQILTSAKLETESHWKFKGDGVISVPVDICLQSAKDFNRLRKIPERFPEVLWDSERSELSLQVKFLGQSRALLFKLFEAPATSDRAAAISFHSLGPWMKGLEGVVLFKDLGRQETEAQMLAKYSGHLRWVPDFVFSFASEAVMHHVALSLRKSLENDYKGVQSKIKTD